MELVVPTTLHSALTTTQIGHLEHADEQVHPVGLPQRLYRLKTFLNHPHPDLPPVLIPAVVETVLCSECVVRVWVGEELDEAGESLLR